MGHQEITSMSSRHVEELLEVYEALVRDATCTFPNLEGEFRKDLERLRRVSRVRGVAVFTVDLPAIGKHLDRCVAEGQYNLSCLPLAGRYSTRTPFPKFLRGLIRLVFEESGLLKGEDLDVEAFMFLRQFLYCAKKTELDCGPDAKAAEVAAFVQVDNCLPIPETVWASSKATEEDFRETYKGFQALGTHDFLPRLVAVGLPRPAAILFLRNLSFIGGFLSTSLGTYNPRDWRFKHGPGAIAERTGPVNKYHWENWGDRLEERFPLADYGYHSYSSWADNGARVGEISSREASSRLVAVPKTFLKPRLIAAEPSENQWCQQNLWRYFRERCEGSWINSFIRFGEREGKASWKSTKTVETLNQTLCKKGSLDGSLLTCDLSAASDRVTCAVVGQLFRGNPGLLCHLQAVRTRFLRQGINPLVPMEIELRKFSTMGSACTFPIESLVFLAITLASVLTDKGERATERKIKALAGSVAVFGDDIIAPNDCWEFLQKALSALHFEVNASKSFATGKFRESCGVDSFRGVDVTPVYWKGICTNAPESIAMTLATSNNFHRKWFMNVAQHMRSTMPCDFVTVAMDSGVEGKKSFARPIVSDYEVRWNRDLQKTEVSTSVLSMRSEKLAPCDDSGLFQYFTEEPDPYVMWSAGVAQKPTLRIRRRWVALELLGIAAWA
jgi:hypothetical protein